MAAITDKVNPGDVISADLFNRVIALLNEHEALIGGVVPIRINSITPSVLRVGEELKVFGSGLAAANLQEISVDGSQVSPGSLRPGSSDGLMIFEVPPLLVPPTGRTVTLLVKNKGGTTAVGSFYVLPAIVATLEASFKVTRTTVAPGGNLAASTSYEFTYSIETYSSMDETYLLEPQLLGAPAGWSVAMKSGQTEVLIPKSQPIPSTTAVVVVVTTGAAGGGTLSLGLRAKNHGGVTGSSTGESIAIGQTPGAPNLDVEFMSPQIVGSTHKYTNGNLYVKIDSSVPASQRVYINPLNVRLKNAGVYTIQTPVVSNSAWTVTVTSSPTIDTTGTPNALKGIVFNALAAAGAPDADLEIPVTGAGSLPDGSFKCRLKLRADPANPSPL